ncbi:hypothetical protein SAMN05421544_1099 [Riemerella columbipharyngis]|uniref:Uncharacterized protein n=1 Tax=Riemerella columbipharyngis TaxID=1071918 RepID=A0A1G7CSF4_9FLAO|nr:hypothetical protein SAMN05421544_1099 [Riemerella columbipharyngis]
MWTFYIENELHRLWHDNIDRGLSSHTKNTISKYTGNKVVKMAATGYNPAFSLINAFRDSQSIILNSDVYSDFIIKSSFQIIRDASIGIRELVKHDRNMDSLLKKYLEYGGSMEWLSQQSMFDTKKTMGKIVDNSVTNKGTKILKYIFGKVNTLNKYSEMMFRLGVFNSKIFGIK